MKKKQAAAAGEAGELKVGEWLYAVDPWPHGEQQIQLAQVHSISEKQIRLGSVDGGNRTGLAFNCRVHFTPTQIAAYGRTELEAWEKHAAAISAELRQLEQNRYELYDRLRRAYHQLRQARKAQA